MQNIGTVRNKRGHAGTRGHRGGCEEEGQSWIRLDGKKRVRKQDEWMEVKEKVRVVPLAIGADSEHDLEKLGRREEGGSTAKG